MCLEQVQVEGMHRHALISMVKGKQSGDDKRGWIVNGKSCGYLH